MPDSPRAVSDAASRFFNNYLNSLIKASIPKKRRRWYVKHVDVFITAQKGQKIKALSGSDIDGYFEMIGRDRNLAGWRFHQIVDAIRILYCDLLNSPVCQDVDWQH